MTKLKQFDILAILLICCTPVLLLETFGITRGIYKIWPIFPFVFGLGSVLVAVKTQNRSPLMVGIGSFLMFSSLFFFYLNFTSWAELATLWPVFIIFIGLTFVVSSLFNKQTIVRILGIGTSLLGISLAFIFTISYSFWPIAIALVGIFILIINHYPHNPHRLERKE